MSIHISFLLSTVTSLPSAFISNNYLTINPGQTVPLTPINLNTTDPGDIFANLMYTMSSVQNGQFTLINNPTQPIVQFTQQQINDGDIQFSSDNSRIAPIYIARVQDSCGLISNPSIAIINFYYAAKLGNNQLVIKQDQNTILTSNNSNAINLNDRTKSLSLQFIISNLQHGHFELLTRRDKPLPALSNSR